MIAIWSRCRTGRAGAGGAVPTERHHFGAGGADRGGLGAAGRARRSGSREPSRPPRPVRDVRSVGDSGLPVLLEQVVGRLGHEVLHGSAVLEHEHRRSCPETRPIGPVFARRRTWLASHGLLLRDSRG